VLSSIITRAAVTDSLESVTAIDHDAEIDPDAVGVDPAAVEGIWSAVERLYRSGIHPAIQLCIRRRGEVILDRAIGYARGGGPHDSPDTRKTAVTTRTPFNIFSASKAVTAMVIHLLDQKHLIHLDDPVCEYIPEFSAAGKEWITIRHVLTHRSGIPNIPPEAMKLDYLSQPGEVIRLLCETEPMWRAGRQLAYHAISGGFVLGEVVRRVTGSTIRSVLQREILGPLGFRWMNYGVARKDIRRVALNYFTGPPILPPVSMLLRRVLGVDFVEVAELSNDPRFMTAIVPAGTIMSTANELSRFYQLLLNGGELDGIRIFEPRTVRRATSEQSYFEFDLTLGMPVRYGMGFMLGGRWLSFYGPDTSRAFGHVGFINIFSWADPVSQISVALMTSGKPLLYLEMLSLSEIVRCISRACPKESAKDAPSADYSRTLYGVR